jgi:hypothetical protein
LKLLLIAPPLLQKLVTLTDHDRTMRLSGRHTARAQRTAATMVAPFKAKSHFLIFSNYNQSVLRVADLV